MILLTPLYFPDKQGYKQSNEVPFRGTDAYYIVHDLNLITDGGIQVAYGDGSTITGTGTLLDPFVSVGGGGSQSLAQTLAIGADANSIGITGLTDLTGDVGSIVSLYSDTLTLIGLTSDLGTQSPDSRVCGDSVIIGDSLALAAFSSIIVVDSLTGVININPSNELDITIGAGLVSKFDATGLYVDTITELTPTEGVLISGAGIKTDIGTLAATGIWKLGNIVTASSVLDGTKYLEVGVDGNRFKLALIV